MPLREHLRELRNRIIIASIALLVSTIGGWFLYGPLLTLLTEPIMGHHSGTGITGFNFSDPAAPFNLKLKLSFYLGIVVSSPVWLYQVWAFIVPGLTRKEKRYAIGYLAVAVPLFLSGIGLAWLVLPNALDFLFELTPENGSNLIDATTYLTFVTQIMLAFGIAFVVPLLLVALNMIGVLSASAMAKGWRVAVFLSFLFAAIASPSPDAGSMLALAFPMVGLFLIALGVAALIDRRRARKALATGFGGLSDDQASPLELDPDPVTADAAPRETSGDGGPVDGGPVDGEPAASGPDRAGPLS